MSAEAEQLVHEWAAQQVNDVRRLWHAAYREGQEEFRRQFPYLTDELSDHGFSLVNIDTPVDEDGNIIDDNPDDPFFDNTNDGSSGFLISIAKMAGQILPFAIGTGIPYLDVLTWFRNNERRITMQADAASWQAQMKGYKDAGADSGLEIDWELDPEAEHCNDCLDFADGSPYTDDNGDNPLPSFPGNGDTECGASCKCSLNYHQPVASKTGGLGIGALLPLVGAVGGAAGEEADMGWLGGLLAQRGAVGLDKLVAEFRERLNAALPEGWQATKYDKLQFNSPWADSHKTDAFTEYDAKGHNRIAFSTEQTKLLKYILDQGPAALESPAAQDALETIIHELLHTSSPLRPATDFHPLKWLLEEGLTEFYAREMFSDVVFQQELSSALKINLSVYKREVEFIKALEARIGPQALADIFQTADTHTRVRMIENGLAKKTEEWLRLQGVSEHDIAELYKPLRAETVPLPGGEYKVSVPYRLLHTGQFDALGGKLEDVKALLRDYKTWPLEDVKPPLWDIAAKGKSIKEAQALVAWINAVGIDKLAANLQALVGWKKSTALMQMFHATGVSGAFDETLHSMMYTRLGTSLVKAGFDKAEVTAMRSQFIKPLWAISVDGKTHFVDLYRFVATQGEIPWKGAEWSGDPKAFIQKWVTENVGKTHVAVPAVAPIVKPVEHFEAPPPIPVMGDIPRTYEALTKLTKVDGPLGSQGGQWYQDEAGHRFLAKPTKDAAHAYNEWMSMQVYRAAGMEPGKDFPLTAVLKSDAGQHYIVSQLVPDLEKHDMAWWKSPAAELAKQQAQEKWGVDVLLAHYDVVGAQWDNMLLNPNGEIVRIESGGAGAYRAMGSTKPSWGSYTGVKDDFSSMRGLTMGNDQLATVFGNMTPEKALESLEQAKNAINLPELLTTLKTQVPAPVAQTFVETLRQRMAQVEPLAKSIRPLEPTTSGGKALSYYLKNVGVEDMKAGLSTYLKADINPLFIQMQRDPNTLMKELSKRTEAVVVDAMKQIGVGPTLRTEAARILGMPITNEKIDNTAAGLFEKLTAYEKMVLSGELPITATSNPQAVFDFLKSYATTHGIDTAKLAQIEAEGKIAVKVGPGGIPMVEGKESLLTVHDEAYRSAAWNPGQDDQSQWHRFQAFMVRAERDRYGPRNAYAEVGKRTGIDQQTISRTLGSWAGSSRTEESTFVHIALSQKFGMELPDWIKDSWNEWARRDEMAALTKLETVRKIVDAFYDVTQEMLASWGYKPGEHIPVMRGMHFTPEQARGLHGGEVIEINDLYFNPVSAFSGSWNIADGFGAGGHIFSMTVPRERIFGMGINGIGTYGEHEVVVLGGKGPVDVVQSTSLSKLRNPYGKDAQPLGSIEGAWEKYGPSATGEAPLNPKELNTSTMITDAMMKDEKVADYVISNDAAVAYIGLMQEKWVHAIDSLGGIKPQRAEWLQAIYKAAKVPPPPNIAKEIAKLVTKPGVNITLYNADEVENWFNSEAFVDSFTVTQGAAKEWLGKHETQLVNGLASGMGGPKAWYNDVTKAQWIKKIYEAADLVPSSDTIGEAIKAKLGVGIVLPTHITPIGVAAMGAGTPTEQAQALVNIMNAGVLYDPVFKIPVEGAKEFVTGDTPWGAWAAKTEWTKSKQQATWIAEIYKAAGVTPPPGVQKLLDEILKPTKTLFDPLAWVSHYDTANEAYAQAQLEYSKGLLTQPELQAIVAHITSISDKEELTALLAAAIKSKDTGIVNDLYDAGKISAIEKKETLDSIAWGKAAAPVASAKPGEISSLWSLIDHVGNAEDPALFTINSDVAKAWIEKQYNWMIKSAKGWGFDPTTAKWILAIYKAAGKKVSPTVAKAISHILPTEVT